MFSFLVPTCPKLKKMHLAFVFSEATLLQIGHMPNPENVVQIMCALIYRAPLNLDYFFRIGYGPILKVRSHNFAKTKTNFHESGFIF